MRYQPNSNVETNDVVFTPLSLAKRIIDHFPLSGRILDPCLGDGAFYDQFPTEDKDWCEIAKGKDFFTYKGKCDWCVSNPPYSLFRNFLLHGMELSDNVVYLISVNHIWTKARIRDIETMGFGIREIYLVDTPANFPTSGFQYGAVWLKRGHRGSIALSRDVNPIQMLIEF